MIKIKSISYQQDNVLALIEYDLEDEIYDFTVTVKQLQVAKMSVNEIKKYVVNNTIIKRANKVKTIVEGLLTQLIDVDLEE